MKDLLIIPDSSGPVDFTLRGGREDDALMLLQRLYVILFSDNTGLYRDPDAGATLYPMLGSGNIPDTAAMDSQLALACGSALASLDEDDVEQISSFTGYSTEDGRFIFTLELNDGTVVSGGINA